MKKVLFLAFGLVFLFVIAFVSAIAVEDVHDPVCGMKLDSSKAKFTVEYRGKKYYFCSADCHEEFKKNPEKYAVSQKESIQAAPFCCSLSEELLAEIEIEKKEVADGLEVTMTSANPEAVKKLQEAMKKCHQEAMTEAQTAHVHCGQEQAGQATQHKHKTETQAACCLMHDQNYEIKLVNLNNGVRVEMKRKKAELPEKIAIRK